MVSIPPVVLDAEFLLVASNQYWSLLLCHMGDTDSNDLIRDTSACDPELSKLTRVTHGLTYTKVSTLSLLVTRTNLQATYHIAGLQLLNNITIFYLYS